MATVFKSCPSNYWNGLRFTIQETLQKRFLVRCMYVRCIGNCFYSKWNKNPNRCDINLPTVPFILRANKSPAPFGVRKIFAPARYDELQLSLFCWESKNDISLHHWRTFTSSIFLFVEIFDKLTIRHSLVQWFSRKIFGGAQKN